MNSNGESNPYNGYNPYQSPAGPAPQLTNRRATAANHRSSNSLGGLSDTGSSKSFGTRNRIPGVPNSPASNTPMRNGINYNTSGAGVGGHVSRSHSTSITWEDPIATAGNQGLGGVPPPRRQPAPIPNSSSALPVSSDFFPTSGPANSNPAGFYAQPYADTLGGVAPLHTPPRNNWNPMSASPVSNLPPNSVAMGMPANGGMGMMMGDGGMAGAPQPSAPPPVDDSKKSGGGWGIVPIFRDLIGSGVSGEKGVSIPPHQRRFGCPEDDLPLYEELGIDLRRIAPKIMAVFMPHKDPSFEVTMNNDLAGPVVFGMGNAALLLLQGKVEFSAVYAQIVLGAVLFRFLLSLMSGSSASLVFVISSLGYALIPNVILSVVRLAQFWIVGGRGKGLMVPLAVMTICWSAWSASALMAVGLRIKHQRYLLFYPSLLFYAVFAALTLF